LAGTLGQFLDALGITKFAMYAGVLPLPRPVLSVTVVKLHYGNVFVEGLTTA
jgi:hypothetical protein